MTSTTNNESSSSINQLNLTIKCLEHQIDELNSLEAILCGPGELKINDPTVRADINEFLIQNNDNNDTTSNNKLIENSKTFLTSHLQFTIRFQLQISKIIVDIHIELPHLYPLVEIPLISVLSSAFNQQAYTKLRKDLDNFIQNLDHTDVYIHQIYEWLLENSESYLTRMDTETTGWDNTSSSTPLTPKIIEMERLWIYSHHLKSKTKRQDMLKLGVTLNLTGFFRPGKPGIICVEGEKINTQEFWRTIRQWAWQKISIRKSEIKIYKLMNMYEKIEFSRFKNGFQEKLLTNSNDIIDDTNDDDSTGANSPMNMSLFMKYLEQHQSSYIKKYLFGFD